MNKILSTEMDVLRRSARKSRMERIKNEHIKEIMRVKGKTDIIDIIEKKKRTSKKNVDGRSTSSHDN
jgi:hypothetical protein